MELKLGRGYVEENAVATFATVLLKDGNFDACIVIDADAKDGGLVDEKTMNASALMACVDGLKEHGLSLAHIITIVYEAYKEGGKCEAVRTRV